MNLRFELGTIVSEEVAGEICPPVDFKSRVFISEQRVARLIVRHRVQGPHCRRLITIDSHELPIQLPSASIIDLSAFANTPQKIIEAALQNLVFTCSARKIEYELQGTNHCNEQTKPRVKTQVFGKIYDCSGASKYDSQVQNSAVSFKPLTPSGVIKSIPECVELKFFYGRNLAGHPASPRRARAAFLRPLDVKALRRMSQRLLTPPDLIGDFCRKVRILDLINLRILKTAATLLTGIRNLERYSKRLRASATVAPVTLLSSAASSGRPSLVNARPPATGSMTNSPGFFSMSFVLGFGAVGFSGVVFTGLDFQTPGPRTCTYTGSRSILGLKFNKEILLMVPRTGGSISWRTQTRFMTVGQRHSYSHRSPCKSSYGRDRIATDKSTIALIAQGNQT